MLSPFCLRPSLYPPTTIVLYSNLELMKIQSSIDRLFAFALHPSLFRKIRLSFLTGDKSGRIRLFNCMRSKLEVNPLLQQLSILTIPERVEWTRLKNTFKALKHPTTAVSDWYNLSPNPHSHRSFPLLEVTRGSTVFIGRSVKFKSIASWNKLPKHWDFDKMTFPQFKKQIFNYLVSSRKDSSLWNF